MALVDLAVHCDDLLEAIKRLAVAAKQGSTYVNPSNDVEFRGWRVPQPETNLKRLLEIRGLHDRNSQDAIEILLESLEPSDVEASDIEVLHTEASGAGNIAILFNLLQPLVCDLTLAKKHSLAKYLIEHKSTGPL